MNKQVKFVYTSSDAPASRRRYTTEKHWEQHRGRILELRDKGIPLKNIIETMERETGFKASVSQYKQRLKNWGAKLHLTKEQRRYMIQKIQQNHATGKIPVFRNKDGSVIDAERVVRLWNRRAKDGVCNSAAADIPFDIELSSGGIIAISRSPSRSYDFPSDAMDWINESSGSLPGTALVSATPGYCEDDQPTSVPSVIFLDSFIATLFEFFGITADYEYSDDQDAASVVPFEEFQCPKELDSHPSAWKARMMEFIDQLIQECERRKSESGRVLGEQEETEGYEQTSLLEGNAEYTKMDGKTSDKYAGATEGEGDRPDRCYAEGDENSAIDGKMSLLAGAHLISGEDEDEGKNILAALEAVGSDDPEFRDAISNYNTAISMYYGGEGDLGEHLVQIASEVILNKFGPDNIWYLRARLLQADVLAIKGHSRESEKISICTDTAARYDQLLGSRHFETRKAYLRLALHYRNNANLDQFWEPVWRAISGSVAGNSIPNYTDRTSLIVRGRGVDGIDFRALQTMVHILMREGEHDQGVRLAKAMFGNWQDFDWSNDSSTGTLLWLVRVLIELDLLPEASQLLNEIRPRSSADNNRRIRLLLGHEVEKIRRLQKDRLDLSNIEDNLLNFLSVMETKLPFESVVAINTLYSLTMLNDQRGDFEKTIAHCERMLKLLEITYGKEHFRVLEMVNAVLIPILTRRGLVRYAKPLAHYTLKVMEKEFGPFHSKTIEAILQASQLTARAAGWEIFEV